MSCGILYMHLLVASGVILRTLCRRQGVFVTLWTGDAASMCQSRVGWIEGIQGWCWKGGMIQIITTYHAMIIGIMEMRQCIMICML